MLDLYYALIVGTFFPSRCYQKQFEDSGFGTIWKMD